jgi:alpha-tubulin suppressor-like RCC1 family protein
VFTPTVLKPLRDKRIMQIACGENHSLVLSDKGDVFSWGRGFEG